MSGAVATSPLKALFKFPFQGPNWRNHFIIGTVLTFAGSIVPIIPLVFVFGYVLQVMRQAIEGQDLELPAWDDWGRLGVDGLRLMLVSLVYLLPGILVFVVGWIIYIAASMVFPLLMAGVEEGGNGAVALVVFVSIFGSLAILMVSMFVGSILILLGIIPLPVAAANLVVEDKVAAAFRVRQWWSLLWVNKLGYFAAWVIVFGLLSLLYFALTLAYYTLVLCCLIPLLAAPISFYLSLIGAALFGQVYRESTTMLAAD